MEKIGIYGGSFDPPHKGHLLLAKNLKEKCGVDRVLIIPAATSPFKEKTTASENDRIEMCKLMFTDSCFEISDIEIKRGGKSYTVDTLKQIKTLYPESELFLFMGEDMLLSFNKWYKYEEILSLCKIAAVCRNEDKENLSLMRKFAETLNKDRVSIFDCDPIEVSSSEIRSSLEKGECLNITEDVYKYIKSKGLYK